MGTWKAAVDIVSDNFHLRSGLFRDSDHFQNVSLRGYLVNFQGFCFFYSVSSYVMLWIWAGYGLLDMRMRDHCGVALTEFA